MSHQSSYLYNVYIYIVYPQYSFAGIALLLLLFFEPFFRTLLLLLLLLLYYINIEKWKMHILMASKRHRFVTPKCSLNASCIFMRRRRRHHHHCRCRWCSCYSSWNQNNNKQMKMKMKMKNLFFCSVVCRQSRLKLTSEQMRKMNIYTGLRMIQTNHMSDL